MPRTRSLALAELKIGVIAVFALVMAAVLIFAVGGGGFWWQRYSLKTIFPNVAGLKQGSPVRLAGVEVGAVDDVAFVPSGVEVIFTVNKDMQRLVTTDSTAMIGSISLLGEGAIDLTVASTGTPVPEWGYVRAVRTPGSIADLSESASAGLEEARKLIVDMRAGRGTLGKLVTDDAVYRDVDAFVKSAQRVASAISGGRGTLGRLTNDPKLYNELEQSIASLNTITTRIRNGEGSLGQLLNDPAFSKQLTATSQNLEAVTDRLNRGEGTAGKLLTDDALYKRIDSLTGRLDAVVEQLNSGQGTAGQLLRDKELYDNMNGTVLELKALIAEIRKDPKKYLNVKVSIF
jgi:phospholipid/cholesterol/gamma-HCH transport system substrate-binding protein